MGVDVRCANGNGGLRNELKSWLIPMKTTQPQMMGKLVAGERAMETSQKYKVKCAAASDEKSLRN